MVGVTEATGGRKDERRAGDWLTNDTFLRSRALRESIPR